MLWHRKPPECLLELIWRAERLTRVNHLVHISPQPLLVAEGTDRSPALGAKHILLIQRSRHIFQMELDNFLQLLFGIVATALAILGLWLRYTWLKSEYNHFAPWCLQSCSSPTGCVFRHKSSSSILPTHNTALDHRQTTYMLEMTIGQDWLGQHAAGWSVGLPKIHRIADH